MLCSFGRKYSVRAKNRGMNRGSYWLTIPQAALELKISTVDVRRLIRSGKLPTVGIGAVDICRVPRDSVEYVKEEIAGGRLRIPGHWEGRVDR